MLLHWVIDDSKKVEQLARVEYVRGFLRKFGLPEGDILYMSQFPGYTPTTVSQCVRLFTALHPIVGPRTLEMIADVNLTSV